MHVMFQEEDLLALLREEENAEDKLVQTDISNEDLERVMDRSDLVVVHSKENGKPQQACSNALPLKGPGWEVVVPTATGGMLSGLNN